MNLRQYTIDRLESQHKTIKQYIDNLPPEAIYNRLEHGKFSIHENIAYLARYQEVFTERLGRIISEINPFFEVYKPDADVQFPFTTARTTGSLLHSIYKQRDHICNMLRELPDELCSRIGTHSILGQMAVGEWTEFFLLHESSQLFKIFKLSGSFWSMEVAKNSNVIYLPRLSNFTDELAV